MSKDLRVDMINIIYERDRNHIDTKQCVDQLIALLTSNTPPKDKVSGNPAHSKTKCYDNTEDGVNIHQSKGICEHMIEMQKKKPVKNFFDLPKKDQKKVILKAVEESNKKQVEVLREAGYFKPVKVEWEDRLLENYTYKDNAGNVWLTSNWKDIKSFIHSLLKEQKERIISEIAQYSPISAKVTRELIKLIKSIKK
jgi:hypothetical protein